ncbi:MAG: tRNA pseudouridine(38-40) synthase TruA [Pseudomonadota bacterium]
MARIALGVQYDGRHFSGWQRQSHAPSIQQTLEDCLSQVADHPVTIYCAGRTDSGVHALNQVVHFESTKPRPARAWVLGTNTLLPSTVSINWQHAVEADFHARFSADARTYQYVISNLPTRSALWADRVCWELGALDAEKMHEAAQAWLGEHDFSAFRAASCQSNTPFRCIQHITVVRTGHFVVIRVTANAFLHHMVRNLAGVLIDIGLGRQEVPWAAKLLASGDRTLAGKTAVAGGLYLTGVTYPERFGLPNYDASFPALIAID